MKKLATVLITLLLVIVSCFMFSACGDDFDGTTMTNWGNIVNGSTGSFYAETQNYIYYINGVGTTTDDNTFGTPVKGSLMAVEKSTLGTDNVKTEIVVPKIFVTSDTDAGFYLFGEGEATYVYYGSPNVGKNSSGKVANTEMTFMRTRLDSKKSEELFTVSSLDTNYRMAEKDGVVYITYYDEEDVALKTYNVSTKKTTTIIEQDDETTTSTTIGDKTVYASLNTYKLLPNGSYYQAIYSTTLYSENYFEDKASQTGYSRQTAKYNVVYGIKAGEEPQIILNGQQDELTFELTLVKDNYLIYKTTDIYSASKTYAVKIDSEISQSASTRLNGLDIFEKDILIETLDKVYVNDTDADIIYTISLTTNNLFASKKIVLDEDDVSEMLKVDGEYIYLITDSKVLERAKLEGEEVVNVSSDTISTTWYNPAFITVGSKNYVFYVDTAVSGVEYVKYVDLDSDVEIVYNEDDATKIDERKLNGQELLGYIIDADIVKIVENKISSIGTTALELTEKDGALVSESVSQARASYNALSDELKEDISDDSLEVLTKSEYAVSLANAYNNLANFEDYDSMDETAKATFGTNYNSAKTLRNEIVQKGESYYTYVRDLIETDYKYYYQEAGKIIED